MIKLNVWCDRVIRSFVMCTTELQTNFQASLGFLLKDTTVRLYISS